MKYDNRFLLAIIAAIAMYVIFLMILDLKILTAEIINFKIEFLPIILSLIPCGWMALYARWSLLLRSVDVHVPFRKNIEIYFTGFALSITPGKVGDLIKSHLLKTKFNIPRTKTAPLVLVEKLYDLVGAVAASIAAIWLFSAAAYVIIAASIMLIFLFVVISYRNIFNRSLVWFGRIKLISKFLQPLADSYEVIRLSTRRKIILFASLLSVFYWLITSLAVYYVLLAFGIDTMNYLNVVSTFTASLILGAASFIPGGIGVAEGSLVGLFSLQGIKVSSALILVILIRVFTLWYGAAVGFIALKLSGGFSIKSS